MQDRLRDPIWQFVGTYVALVALIVAVLFGLDPKLQFLATPVGKLLLVILIFPPVVLCVGLMVPVAVVKENTVRFVSTIQSFFRSTWGRRILAFGLLLGLLISEYARPQLSLWPVGLFALQLLLLLGLVLNLIRPTALFVLVYDFIDRFEEAKVLNEAQEIKPVERVLSRRSGGTEMRAIWAHPGYADRDTEVSYELPAKFVAAHEFILLFAVAVLGEHPLEERQCGFEDRANNKAKFEVRVNGKTVFERVFGANDPGLYKWEQHQIAIKPTTEIKRRTLKVDLVTNAMGDLHYNWTAWGEPKLVAVFHMRRVDSAHLG